MSAFIIVNDFVSFLIHGGLSFFIFPVERYCCVVLCCVRDVVWSGYLVLALALVCVVCCRLDEA